MYAIYAEFFIGLVIALNPVASLTCYLTFTSHLSPQEKRAFLRRSMTTALITLIAAIIFGQLILKAFGISLGPFRIAAGLTLLLIGLKMMREGPEKPDLTGMPSTGVEIVPYAIPIVVGPATLGFITSFTENIPGFWDEVMFIGLAVLAIILFTLILNYSHYLSKVMGEKGMDIMTRIIGLILMGIGAEGATRGAFWVYHNQSIFYIAGAS